MFRKFLRNKKAQNTAEYALLISLVVAGVIAMQTYAQRTIQGRIRDASLYLKNQTSDLGGTVQYEPYYLKSDYTVTRTDDETQRLVGGLTSKQLGGITKEALSNRVRDKGGYQVSLYNTAMWAGGL